MGFSTPHWPLFDLRVRTPRLELRYPDDADVVALADLAAEGIHPPDFMPFKHPWSDEPPPRLQRNSLQHFWQSRGAWTPQKWGCPMTVVVDGVVVGVQGIHADEFALRKVVATGSWLGQAHQGRGIGKEMRAAILHLGFAGLGAVRAESGAFEDNVSSLGVSRALGYRENGDQIHKRREATGRVINLVMTRASWEQHRRDDIELEGLEPCLELFGAADVHPDTVAASE